MTRRIAIIALLTLLAACSDDEASKDDVADATNSNNETNSDSGTTSNNEGASDGGTNSSGSDVNFDGCRADGDQITTIVFENRCDAPLQVEGSDIDGASIAPGDTACRDIGSATEELSAKRYWGYIGEELGGGNYTLAEFTFNTDFNDFDWYNISHVDAHNLTMQIVPLDRDDCETLTCSDEALLTECPEVGQVRNDQDELVACVSPDRDDPQGEVPLHFESCDEGYAWSLDDAQGEDPSPVRACAGEDWAIIFCP